MAQLAARNAHDTDSIATSAMMAAAAGFLDDDEWPMYVKASSAA